MIPSSFITAWRKNAPWIENSQVEQDLIIARSLDEIFNDPFLKEHLWGYSFTQILHEAPAKIFRRYRPGSDKTGADQRNHQAYSETGTQF